MVYILLYTSANKLGALRHVGPLEIRTICMPAECWLERFEEVTEAAWGIAVNDEQ